jgi:cell wall-associated NlpC family hydrolase
MSSDEQRAKVVEVARTFINTRYHHHGKVKGVGVDCATFLALVFAEAGVIPPVDIENYSNQWHLHHDEPLYENAVVANGGRIVDAGTGPGDIILYFQGKQFAHGAIITRLDPLRIIHAYAPSRRVVEGAESEFGTLIDARRKFFTTW